MLAIRGGPFRTWATGGLIVSYMALGEEDQAKSAAEKLIKANSGFTISGYARLFKNFPFKDFDWLKKDAEILRSLGLPN